MAAMDNENTNPDSSASGLTLSDATIVSSAQAGQLLLVGPDGFVSQATIDESGVVRELQQTVDATDMASNDDILQQAFQEAGNDFVDESGAIQDEIGEEEQMDPGEGGTISYLTTEDGQIINSVIESTFTGEDGNQYAVIKCEEDGSQQIVMTSRCDDKEMEIPDSIQLQEPEGEQAYDQTQLQVPELIENGAEDSSVYINQGVQESTEPAPPAPSNEKPLGSSDNPIRIIQQGNQYTSLQQLTSEQLQHIMQVLQQQQIVKPAQKQGTTTLYSPQTNTKIVYRVIYPGEKKNALTKSNVNFALNNFSGRGRGRGRGKVIPSSRGRGRPRKYPVNDEDADSTQFPELSKEEKEKRKKVRHRTRSGRVSKPPKHMVKDYKQIHLVDWAEDYDDSDGGYSDFRPSDEEREDGDDESIGQDEESSSSYASRKPRNFKCEVCSKCYLGQASLNRHFRLNPEHGTPTEDGRNVPNGAMNEESNSSNASAPGPNKQKIFRRGKLPQRLHNLREVVQHFTNEELMEIVLPRLTQCVSTWEFMLMKSEKPEPGGTALRPSIPEMLKEYETLLKDVRQYGSERLSKIDEEPTEKENAVKIDDETVAASLGLCPSVWYQVEPDNQPYVPMKYKFSKAAENFKEKLETAQNVSPEPPAKRVRIDESSVSNGQTSTMRSLLSNQGLFPGQTTLTLSPNMKGQGQGRIIVGPSGSDSPGIVSLNAGSVPGTLAVSDLITIRPSDDDVLVMDTKNEGGELSHSPEAMLQPQALHNGDSPTQEGEKPPEGGLTEAPVTSESDQQVPEPRAELNEEQGQGDAGNVVIMQTEEGMLLIQKPDGSTLQVQHSGEALSMETVQYLLSLDTSQLQTDAPTGDGVQTAGQ